MADDAEACRTLRLMNNDARPSPAEDEDPNSCRARILQAAIDEFASVGFTGARVDRIAEASGCNKQLIYYYFQHKAGLWTAALMAMTENASTDWFDGELSDSIRHQVYAVSSSARVW